MSAAMEVVLGEWEAQAESLRTARWVDGNLIDGSGTWLDFLDIDKRDHSVLLACGGPTAVLTPDPMARRSTFLLTVSYGDAEHSEPVLLPEISGFIINQMGLGFYQ